MENVLNIEIKQKLKPTKNKLALIVLEALRAAVSKLNLPKENDK